MNVPILLTTFIDNFNHYTIGGNLLFVLKNYDVANFDILKLAFNYVILLCTKGSYFSYQDRICFLVRLVTLVISYSLLKYTNYYDYSEDDSNYNGGVYSYLGEAI